MSTEVDRGLGLEREGIETSRVKWNLSPAALYEEALRRDEGVLAAHGPLACRTGQHTGRSPNDKYLVREPSSESHIAWGAINRPMEPPHFEILHRDIQSELMLIQKLKLRGEIKTEEMTREEKLMKDLESVKLQISKEITDIEHEL